MDFYLLIDFFSNQVISYSLFSDGKIFLLFWVVGCSCFLGMIMHGQ